MDNLKPPGEEKLTLGVVFLSPYHSYTPTLEGVSRHWRHCKSTSALLYNWFTVTYRQAGSFSEDPSCFTSNFQTLTLAFSMSWRNLYIILTTCCSPDEKQWMWEEACKHANQLHIKNPGTNQPAAQAVSDQDPKWRYTTQAGIQNADGCNNRLSTGRNENLHQETCNYEKIREITQGKEENPVLFRNRRVEAFRKCTNLDPSSLECQILTGHHFISQPTPDTRRKLQKLQTGPQTSLDQLMDVAFSIFNTGIWRKENRESRKGRSKLSSLHYL